MSARPGKELKAYSVKGLVSLSMPLITTGLSVGAVCQSLNAAPVKVDADIAAFVAAKREQIERTATGKGADLPSEVRKMLAVASSGDWRSTSNLFASICVKLENFAKLRSATAGLYSWRATRAKSSSERRRMVRAAELAFKQAYLFHPGNPEAIWRYTMFLVELDRVEDAEKFTTTAARLNPDIPAMSGLTNYVRQTIDWKKRAR